MREGPRGRKRIRDGKMDLDRRVNDDETELARKARPLGGQV